MPEEGTTAGVWVGKDDRKLFDDFDDHFRRHGRGSYSRSDRMKDAMELYLAVHRALLQAEEAPDPEDMDAREVRMVAKQAVFDHFRE